MCGKFWRVCVWLRLGRALRLHVRLRACGNQTIWLRSYRKCDSCRSFDRSRAFVKRTFARLLRSKPVCAQKLGFAVCAVLFVYFTGDLFSLKK